MWGKPRGGEEIHYNLKFTGVTGFSVESLCVRMDYGGIREVLD